MALGAGILAGFQVGKVSPALPYLRADLHLDLVVAGWLTSICYATSAVLAVVTGLFADRIGPRRLVLSGMALLAAGSLLGAVAETASELLATRWLESFGFVAVTVTAPRLLGAAARGRDHGLVFGIWGAYMPLGMALALATAPMLLADIGWRGFWVVSGVLVTAFTVLLWLGLRPRRWPAAFPGRAIDRGGAYRTLVSAVLWLFGISFALYTLQWFAIMAWLPTFLIETRGDGPAEAALRGAAVVAVNAAGNGAAAWLMHRGTPRPLLIGIAFLAMGGASAGIFHEATGEEARMVLALVFSAVGGLLPAAAIAGAAARAPGPAFVAMASGFVVQGAALGSLLGPPALAAAVEGLGGWAASWWMMPAVSATGLALAVGIAVVDRNPES